MRSISGSIWLLLLSEIVYVDVALLILIFTWRRAHLSVKWKGPFQLPSQDTEHR